MGTAGLWQQWFDVFTRIPRALTPPLLWSVVEGISKSVGLLDPEAPNLSIDSLPEAVLVARPNGRIAAANARAVHLFGRSTAELTDLPLDALFRIVPGDPGGFGFELHASKPGEKAVAVEASTQALEGAEHLIVAIVRDVTIQRAAEREHRADERRLQLALDTGRIGTWIVDVQTSTAIWDERLHQMFGLAPHTFPGTFAAFLQLVHPDDRPKTADHVMRATQEGQPFEFDFRALLPGARVRYMTCRADVLRDERGRSARIAGVCMDLTERVFAQQRLQRAHDELERRVTERTDELKRSVRELDDFAQIVSHDLKEPLRGIYNYARFVLEDDGKSLGADARQKLDRISRLASRMNDLIDSILKSARVGHLSLEQDVDVGQVVADVATSLESLMSENGVVLRVAEQFPKLACDAQGLAEVFRNLMANAVKYNDKASKTVEVGSAVLDGHGTTVFYVRDNGIGIAEEYLCTVFQMFRRLHARDAFGGGTGAGLAIAKKIVELHGGRIWVESRTGEGSTFYFTMGGEQPAVMPA